MKLFELKRSSVLLIILGSVLTLLGITIFWRPQSDTINMFFLSMMGIGLFMVGLGFSVLNQIRKTKPQS
jgi:hypothetical protein